MQTTPHKIAEARVKHEDEQKRLNRIGVYQREIESAVQQIDDAKRSGKTATLSFKLVEQKRAQRVHSALRDMDYECSDVEDLPDGFAIKVSW